MIADPEGVRATPMSAELADGLILRSARVGDRAELAEFNGTMHADVGVSHAEIAEWTLDLFDTEHPTFRADRDVTVVEDTTTGRIVSALFLIPQVWTYAGVAMNVGQPELIATHPDYRRRGLVRAQFEVIHRWSGAAGHLWQMISGIPWYYRQFGYSYVLDLPARPVMWLSTTPPPGTSEVSLRAATTADIEFLATMEAGATSGTSLGALRGVDGFALELVRRPGGLCASEMFVIEPATPNAAPVGYVAYQRRLADGLVSVRAMELRRDVSWIAPTAAVIAHLHEWVRVHPDGLGRGVRFALPSEHPAIRCAATRLGSGPPGSYGLYVRVPDLAALLRHIAPVLDVRLEASPAVAWTGELRLDFYTAGLCLRFEAGHVVSIEPWSPLHDSSEVADASLPLEDFLHLLFGSRSIGDRERATADCLINTDVGAVVLDALFPAMPMSTVGSSRVDLQACKLEYSIVSPK